MDKYDGIIDVKYGDKKFETMIILYCWNNSSEVKFVNWITLSYAVSSAILLSAVMLLVAKMDNWFSYL